MPEKTMNDTQQITYTLDPKTEDGRPGRLDSVPAWRVVSGNGTFVANANGREVLLVSETLADDMASADTEYEVSAMAGGVTLTESVITHIDNDVTPIPAATSLGGGFGVPEPKA